MNENTKNLSKIQINDEKTNNTSISQLLQLKTQLSELNTGNMSPTQLNMLTVSFPIGSEQRNKITERSFKSKNTRRNSTLIDRQTIQKRRSSKTDTNNTSLTSSTGSILFQKYSSVEKIRQKTHDSMTDAISNADCKNLNNFFFSHFSNLILINLIYL